MATKSKKEKTKKAKKRGFQKVVMLRKKKETKGTVCYEEVGDDGEVIETDEAGKVLGSQYIRKSAFDSDDYPEELVVTISDNITMDDGDDDE